MVTGVPAAPCFSFLPVCCFLLVLVLLFWGPLAKPRYWPELPPFAKAKSYLEWCGWGTGCILASSQLILLCKEKVGRCARSLPSLCSEHIGASLGLISRACFRGKNGLEWVRRCTNPSAMWLGHEVPRTQKCQCLYHLLDWTSPWWPADLKLIFLCSHMI